MYINTILWPLGRHEHMIMAFWYWSVIVADVSAFSCCSWCWMLWTPRASSQSLMLTRIVRTTAMWRSKHNDFISGDHVDDFTWFSRYPPCQVLTQVRNLVSCKRVKDYYERFKYDFTTVVCITVNCNLWLKTENHKKCNICNSPAINARHLLKKCPKLSTAFFRNNWIFLHKKFNIYSKHYTVH